MAYIIYQVILGKYKMCSSQWLRGLISVFQFSFGICIQMQNTQLQRCQVALLPDWLTGAVPVGIETLLLAHCQCLPWPTLAQRTDQHLPPACRDACPMPSPCTDQHLTHWTKPTNSNLVACNFPAQFSSSLFLCFFLFHISFKKVTIHVFSIYQGFGLVKPAWMWGTKYKRESGLV